MSNYNAENIRSMDAIEHMRQCVGMYLGSADSNGLHHCVKEVVSNSIDEWLNSDVCTEIDIKLLQDGGITIRDNGRSIPHGTHESGCSTLQACAGIAMTGGKFDNEGNSGYNTSGGMHGEGLKAVNATSNKFIISTSRDGIKEICWFEKGQFIKHEEEKDEYRGVVVTFYPDETIFNTVEFDYNRIKEMIREFSFLCKGLKFTIEDEKTNNKETFLSNKGLSDYLDFLNKDKKTITKPIYINEKEGNFEVEIAFVYNEGYNSSIKLYTNNIPQLSGTHLTGFKTALTSTLNNIAKEEKLLKEKDSNLTGSDYEEGQVTIINFKMINPVFKGQNKEDLASAEGRTYVQKLTKQGLDKLLVSNKKDFKAIINKALSAKKAREAAKKARDAARNPKEKGLKASLTLSEKFIGCSSKDPNTTSLMLVEGTSAASSAVEARNPVRDAIYMLRGKTISPLKNSLDKILANQEMSDITRVIGAGIGDSFDEKKMNFNKIVITADGDPDGNAIELLLITFFYTYMRPLVEKGHLYRAITPLATIKQNGKDNIYCYTFEEIETTRASMIGKYEIEYAKGLGSLDPQELKKVCFENENYKQITISDAAAADEILEILEGKKVEPRKKFIYDNAEKLGFNFQ